MLKTLLTIVGLSAVIAIPAQSLLLSLKAGKTHFGELFEHKKILLRYILTMFILTPFLAVIFFWIFGARDGLWVGIFVIAVTPASPGMVKKMSKLSGEHNVSIAWMITTIFLSLIFIPINLTIVQNYLDLDVNLGIEDVFLKLMLMFILPMAIGFLISEYLNKYAASLIKILDPLTKIAMLALVVSLLILSVPLIISKGIIPLLLILAFIIVALIIAHFMGSPEKLFGPILPYSVISRLPAPAIILMQINNTVEKHMSVVLTYTILGVIVMILYDKLIFKNKDQGKQEPS
jgi:predicted Na+-dependent transporter